MARIQWTPAPADAEKYGIDGPQVFDTETLLDQPSSVLEGIEVVLREHVGIYITDLYPLRTRVVGIGRAIMWITLRLAGRDLAWADFDPQTLRTEFGSWEDDANPPAEAPAGESSPAE